MVDEIAKRILDYIIEQGAVIDGKNIEIEQKIINTVLKEYDKMGDRILDVAHIHGDINTILKHQNMMNRIQHEIEIFYSNVYKLIMDDISDYANKGYNDTSKLIDTGMELHNNPKQVVVRELKGKPGIMMDPNAIEFLKKHAYERIKGLSNDILDHMKSELGSLLIQKVYDRGKIGDTIEKVLHTDRKRAELITQTELSMAYNQGAVDRMSDFNSIGGPRMLKYWHGFKYSERTCTVCRPRIGEIYDLNDNSVSLPAHPRCRCVWLPFVEGWDKPISTRDFMRNADTLKRVYDVDAIYRRINERLGIDYGNYLKPEDALAYLSGKREGITDKLVDARDKVIDDKIKAFDIATEDAKAKLGNEFNTQIRFWKNYVAEHIVDRDKEQLSKAYQAIQGVMILPWTGDQLYKWNKLLDEIERVI